MLCVQFAAAEEHSAAGALSRGGARPQQQPDASPLAAPQGTCSGPGPLSGWAQGHCPGTQFNLTGHETRHAAWIRPPSSGAPTGGTAASEGSSGWGHAAWQSPPGSGALGGGTAASQGSSGWGHAAWASPPRSGALTGATSASEGSPAWGTPPEPALTPSGVAFPTLGAISALRAAADCTANSAQDGTQWRASAWPARDASDPCSSALASADATDSGGGQRWAGARSPDPTLRPGLGAVRSGGGWPWAETRSPNPDLSPGPVGTPRGAGAHGAFVHAWDGDEDEAPSPSPLAALEPLAPAALSPRSAVKQQVRPTCCPEPFPVNNMSGQLCLSANATPHTIIKLCARAGRAVATPPSSR